MDLNNRNYENTINKEKIPFVIIAVKGFSDKHLIMVICFIRKLDCKLLNCFFDLTDESRIKQNLFCNGKFKTNSKNFRNLDLGA